jgi:putative ABC transport system substrate-binding protein
MRRRAFLGAVGGAAVWPVFAQAQQSNRLRRIGILNPRSEHDAEAQSALAALRQRLKQLGWEDGKNVQFDQRSADGNVDHLLRQAAELVGSKPDVIFTNSTPGVAALQSATRTTPVVFVNANNPVGSGFVASLARPGGNITGFVAFEPTMGGKWAELLKEIAPSIKRLGFLFNPQTNTGQYSASAQAAARKLSLEVELLTFGETHQLERVIGSFAGASNGGLVVFPDTSTNLHHQLIVSLAALHRLPAIYPYRLFSTSGGLVYYGIDVNDQFRLAASYLDRVLKGEKPGDLPVQAPIRFELVINLKTAKALGIDVPLFLQQRADELIE